jgi:hypothetical protein
MNFVLRIIPRSGEEVDQTMVILNISRKRRAVGNFHRVHVSSTGIVMAALPDFDQGLL